MPLITPMEKHMEEPASLSVVALNITSLIVLGKTTYKLQGGNIILATVYCPPRFLITENQFMVLFCTLGDQFFAAGDYNAKHTQLGSRLVNPKLPDLIDFAIVRKIPLVSSDHSPELLNIFRQPEIKKSPRHLTTSATSWL